ncbi:MAG TPA: hypothetical protein VL326_26730 [Kofleriaceae bacterium]|nr:hypothetical protein [Kofleriaceae bacterium]
MVGVVLIGKRDRHVHVCLPINVMVSRHHDDSGATFIANARNDLVLQKFRELFVLGRCSLLREITRNDDEVEFLLLCGAVQRRFRAGPQRLEVLPVVRDVKIGEMKDPHPASEQRGLLAVCGRSTSERARELAHLLQRRLRRNQWTLVQRY